MFQFQSSQPEYENRAIDVLESLWGYGHLAPGEPQEVDRIVSNLDFDGANVLDVGCGTGGVTVHLANTYPLSRITGYDVEASVLEQAKRNFALERLGDRLSFVLGRRGRLPFENGEFDIVFSKDALFHVVDKERLFADIHRITRPGGYFAASDWLTSCDDEPSNEMSDFLQVQDLSLRMASAARYKSAMRAAGFVHVRSVNRNAWYREMARTELVRRKGPLYKATCASLGKENADMNIRTWEAMQVVLDSGELCPTHLFALKPE